MTSHKDLSNFRENYSLSALNESDVPAEPLNLFNEWLDQAIAAGLPEPNAMTLATIDLDGFPAARVVLLKEISNSGFVFYTNYDSDKGIELSKNPNASLVFLWLEMQRQVRVVGQVSKVHPKTSDAYFALRPRGSQIGAWISPQSRPIPNREVLEKEYEAMLEKDQPLKRPPHWGGYRLMPKRVEFWQGRENRLHDRILYVDFDDNWKIFRLAP